MSSGCMLKAHSTYFLASYQVKSTLTLQPRLLLPRIAQEVKQKYIHAVLFTAAQNSVHKVNL